MYQGNPDSFICRKAKDSSFIATKRVRSRLRCDFLTTEVVKMKLSPLVFTEVNLIFYEKIGNNNVGCIVEVLCDKQKEHL